MVAIVSLLLVVSLSIFVTRVASIALTLTGLSRESARFQARSAFSGVGFTTKEAEGIVNHPVRRRIVLFLMLLGNAGIVTVVSSLVLGFVNVEATSSQLIRVLVLVGGLVVLWFISRSRYLDRILSRVMRSALKRWTRLDVRDYAQLLHIAGGYGVRELAIRDGDWISDRTLEEVQLREEGVVILGIERPDGTYLPAPKGPTLMEAGDVLVLYGPQDVIERLDQRRVGPEGDREHEQMVRLQQARVAKQDQVDPAARHPHQPHPPAH